MDNLKIGIGAGGQVRVLAATTTELVREGVRRHDTSPTASAALGRVLTGAAVLAAGIKDFDRLTIRFDGNGPAGSVVGEADNDGNVRGYIKNPKADAELTDAGKFDVRGIVGEGMLYVIRESGFEIGLKPDPYVGTVPIVSGEIAEDLAHYLLNSEQIPSAVLLGVLIGNTEPFVVAAGGVVVQMMPGANEHIVTMIEDTIRHAPHLTTVVRDGAGPEDLVSLVLGDIPYEIVESREIRFNCGCSTERAESLIRGLGRAEIESMLSEDKGAMMSCGFCNEDYEFDERGLEKILSSLDA